MLVTVHTGTFGLAAMQCSLPATRTGELCRNPKVASLWEGEGSVVFSAGVVNGETCSCAIANEPHMATSGRTDTQLQRHTCHGHAYDKLLLCHSLTIYLL